MLGLFVYFFLMHAAHIMFVFLFFQSLCFIFMFLSFTLQMDLKVAALATDFQQVGKREYRNHPLFLAGRLMTRDKPWLTRLKPKISHSKS